MLDIISSLRNVEASVVMPLLCTLLIHLLLFASRLLGVLGTWILVLMIPNGSNTSSQGLELPMLSSLFYVDYALCLGSQFVCISL